MGKHSQAFGKLALMTAVLAIWAGAAIPDFSVSAKAPALQTWRFSNHHFNLQSGAAPISQTFKVEGVQRSALVFASSAPPPKTGAPLIVAFHGHGGNSQVSARKFLFHKA